MKDREQKANTCNTCQTKPYYARVILLTGFLLKCNCGNEGSIPPAKTKALALQEWNQSHTADVLLNEVK